MDKNHRGSFYQSYAMPVEKSDEFGNNTKALKKQFYIDAFYWGFVSWLIGYLLGIIFFLLRAVGYDRMGPLANRNRNHALGTFGNDKRRFVPLLSALADCLDADSIVFEYLFIARTLKPPD